MLPNWAYGCLARPCRRSHLSAFRLLDVLRGRAFSITQAPLQGDEEQQFLRMYAGLIQERDGLRRLAEE
nr:hypothetical protein [Methylobacterium radiotolerans JCM 2831]